MGPYYYFSDYENAIKQIKEQENKSKIGLVRLAIFLGKILIKIDDFDNDNDDEEDWTEIYDSVYLGKIIENNNNQLLNHNYVLKTMEQQHPLSFHYIDNNSNSII